MTEHDELHTKIKWFNELPTITIIKNGYRFMEKTCPCGNNKLEYIFFIQEFLHAHGYKRHKKA